MEKVGMGIGRLGRWTLVPALPHPPRVLAKVNPLFQKFYR